MLRKTIVTSALACLLTVGAATTATAAPQPQWVPVFYFGTQLHCNQAGMAGQQMGALTPGTWMCDSGWLMVQNPNTP
ncbi:hypothetical protein [Actinophytocola gossypii]|uniref:Secreted protein n=1 Tax=Actinophytocola gossypii TaxID=2812003 RepID=A0ABT2J220_9PSEU|nr:hypothetical protein [Actinophytocola gossypii]MCT2581903.1 hypothetical protein [Actinophytocola gossypii]